MRRARIPVLILISLSLCFIFYGCGKNKSLSGDGKTIVSINKYEMSSDEFRGEARLTMPGKYLSGQPEKAKDELLEEIITKQVLLQEAQKENLDKDAAFRKEIQRYWEQALLKLLIKAKIAEFSKMIKIPDNELRQEKIREELDKWIKGLRNRANIKIYRENLKELKLQ